MQRTGVIYANLDMTFTEGNTEQDWSIEESGSIMVVIKIPDSGPRLVFKEWTDWILGIWRAKKKKKKQVKKIN